MIINGKITGIKYKTFLSNELKEFTIENFNINASASVFLLKDRNYSFAVSKWVSPKRTRSYPYERVYNTLSHSKKITIIPVIKDEGAAGDRDFLQWDTVSLMSLLDVYVILAYYKEADKKNAKITNQKFDNNYIINKIKEIEHYHSSALHWNLNELKSIDTVIEKTIESYTEIENITGVKLHSIDGIDQFLNRIQSSINEFMRFSREKAKNAQQREFLTIQPKEIIEGNSKSKIVITNYLGGQYFFTVDEIIIDGNNIQLIESKHSKRGKLPSKSDIKDGILKLILYTNIENVKVDNRDYKAVPVLKLTSERIIGEISNCSDSDEITAFFKVNQFTNAQIAFIDSLFKEATYNKFNIIIKNSK